MTRLIVDANVMVGALLGRSLPAFTGLLDRNVELLAPIPMLIEAEKRLNRDTKLVEGEAERRFAQLLEIVTPLPAEGFASYEQAARERLEPHSQSDWPLVAAAMAMEAGIWTGDRDLFGTGVELWATRNVRFVEGDDPEVPA